MTFDPLLQQTFLEKCHLEMEKFFQPSFSTHPLRQLSKSLYTAYKQQNFSTPEKGYESIESLCHSLAKHVETLALKTSFSEGDKKIEVALKKLILERFFELITLYSSFLPYHNIFHTLKVAEDTAFIVEGKQRQYDKLTLPWDLVETFKAIYHDLRFFYENNRRQVGTHLTQSSEGLSVSQVEQDLQALEMWIHKHFAFSFRFASSFHLEVKNSLFHTVASFHPDPFLVYNNSLFDPELNIEGLLKATKDFCSDKQEICIEKYREKWRDELHKNPELAATVEKQLPQKLLALADLSSCLSSPNEWIEEVDALFLEEQLEAHRYIKSIHLKKASFPLLSEEEKKHYLSYFSSYEKWLYLQLHFSRSRYTALYLGFFLPLKTCGEFLEKQGEKERAILFGELSKKIEKRYLLNQKNNHLHPCISLADQRFLASRDTEKDRKKAFSDPLATKAQILEKSYPNVGKKHPWRLLADLLRVGDERMLSPLLFSKKAYARFLERCKLLRRFP